MPKSTPAIEARVARPKELRIASAPNEARLAKLPSENRPQCSTGPMLWVKAPIATTATGSSDSSTMAASPPPTSRASGAGRSIRTGARPASI